MTLTVSIHAPREGCDGSKEAIPEEAKVSIHTPREGCDSDKLDLSGDGKGFQFTHPGRGATNAAQCKWGVMGVSIHAPREGCDPFV